MNAGRAWRAALPVSAFAVVLALHVAYRAFFPETVPGQERWVSVPTAQPSPVAVYLHSQAYFLGLSYASAAAFAVVAFRRYKERRHCADRNLALGGIGISGVLAVAGCFLVGCCGSPMLGVYVSLVGAWILPLTGPLTLAITLLSLAGGWHWMTRAEHAAARKQACCAQPEGCDTATAAHDAPP